MSRPPKPEPPEVEYAGGVGIEDFVLFIFMTFVIAAAILAAASRHEPNAQQPQHASTNAPTGPNISPFPFGVKLGNGLYLNP